MAAIDIDEYVRLIPAVSESPDRTVWVTYDPEADTLYVNFRRPSVADDSELTDDDLIVRYAGGEIIGATVLHASRRLRASAKS
jgi:uncharacterized protein YuzE